MTMEGKSMYSPNINLSQEKWLQINHLTLSMAKLDSVEEIRRVFMEQLNYIIPHKKSFFDLAYMLKGSVKFFDPLSLNMTQEQLNDYYEKYEDMDYCAWLLPTDEPVIYRDSNIITDSARERTTIYKCWMKPMDIYYSMGSTLFENGILYGSITLFRDKSEDFSDEEMSILQILTEHITANLSCLYPKGIWKSVSYYCSDNIADKYNISVRENEVIALVFRGFSNKEISDKLFISVNTVKKHMNNIFRRINVSSRAQLIQKMSLAKSLEQK